MKRRHNPLEFYETPPGFTRFLDQNLMIHGRVYCPCVGDGAIIRALREKDQGPWPLEARTFVTNDIDPNRPADYHIDAQLPEAWWFGDKVGTAAPILLGPVPDWVVENPPFSVALPILQHALAVVNVGVALHLRISFPEPTVERAPLLVEHPPDGMFYLPRYSFGVSPTTGKRGSDSTCTAWCIWVTDAYKRNDVVETIFYDQRRILVAPRAVARETFDDREGQSQGPGVPAEAPAAAGGESA